jgi:hypothetical protein
MADVNALVDYEYKVSGAEQAGSQMQGLSLGATAVAAALAAATAAAIATAKALYDMTVETAASNAELYNSAAAANVSIESYQALNYVLRQTTGQTDGAGTSLRALNNFLISAGEGSERYVDVLNTLNLRYEDLIALDPAERYLVITDAIGGLTDATQQNLAATTVFGTRYATQVVGALNQADGSMRGMMDTFNESAMQISTENVTSLKAFDDAMTDLQLTADNMKAQLATALTPAFGELNDAAMELLPVFEEELAEAIPFISELITEFADDILTYGPQLIALIGNIIDALEWLKQASEDAETATRWIQGYASLGVSELIRGYGELSEAQRITRENSEFLASLPMIPVARGESLDVVDMLSGIAGGATAAGQSFLTMANDYASANQVITASGAIGGASGSEDPTGLGKADFASRARAQADAAIAILEATDAKRAEIDARAMGREQAIYEQRMQAIQGVADRSIDIIVGGFTGGFDKVIDGFKNMLGDMAAEYLKSSIYKAIFGVGAKAATGGAGFFL